MTSTTTPDHVRLCKFLRVPPQQVYDAWLKPEVRMKWWGADPAMTCSFCDIEPKVGGAYRVGMNNPKHGPDHPDEPAEFVVSGRFTELDPPHRMAFTWAWEAGPGAGFESEVTLDFLPAEHDGQPATELVLTHTRLPNGMMRSEHCAGWVGCLRNLGYHFHNTWPAETAAMRG